MITEKRTKVKVRRVPDYAWDSPYIVFRRVEEKGQLTNYFWGAYESAERAMEVSYHIQGNYLPTSEVGVLA